MRLSAQSQLREGGQREVGNGRGGSVDRCHCSLGVSLHCLNEPKPKSEQIALHRILHEVVLSALAGGHGSDASDSRSDQQHHRQDLREHSVTAIERWKEEGRRGRERERKKRT